MHAQTESALYSFKGGADGEYPYSGLVGANGEIYGTALQGGQGGQSQCDDGCGVVFKVTHAGKAKVILTFNLPNGAYPFAGLIRDAQGNFYGTTFQGGAHAIDGAVFKLASTGEETLVYSFSGPDGAFPYAGLVQDALGNLYGTTVQGGTDNFGTVFKITLAGEETILHNFTGGADGGTPYGGLVQDANGNFYGTTSAGGSSLNCTGGCGTVFEITAAGTEKVIYSFTGADGQLPYASLVKGKNGSFYGTTTEGGTVGSGTVFEVTPAGKEKVLYSFENGTDGSAPYGVLVQDSKGNLYGTTSAGGDSLNCTGGCGTVFELTTAGILKVLHTFSGETDGGVPNAGLIMDASGNLYSTTTVGGASGFGTVFQIVP